MTLLSFLAYPSIIDFVESFDESSITMTSISFKVWFKADSIQRPINFSELYAGIITLTFGLASSLFSKSITTKRLIF